MATTSRTLRLDWADPTLREWDATVLAAGPDGIVLDRSAFYPGGGGQPPDTGVLLWGGVQTRIAGARKTADDVYLLPARFASCARSRGCWLPRRICRLCGRPRC